MIRFLAPAALAAVIGMGAFAAPAGAQVGVGVTVGGDGYRHDRPYYRHGHGYGPSVRVYSGRNSYRDTCRERRTVKWVNGRKIVRMVRVCD